MVSMYGMEEYKENKIFQQVLTKKIAENSGSDNQKIKTSILIR